MPLSGTMNPNPLETSNHLITPAISMTDAAASSIRLPSESDSNTKLVAGPLGPIAFDVMWTHAATVLAPLPGASRISEVRYHSPRPGKEHFFFSLCAQSPVNISGYCDSQWKFPSRINGR